MFNRAPKKLNFINITKHPFLMFLFVCTLFTKETMAKITTDTDDCIENINNDANNLFPHWWQPALTAQAALDFSTQVDAFKIGIVFQTNTGEYDTGYTPNSGNAKHIREALNKVANYNNIQLLLENKVTIMIAPESYMMQQTGLPDYTGCYISNYNLILLNEFIFKDWSVIKAEQLQLVLANELSHAAIYNRHPHKNKKNIGFKALVPWTNNHEKSTYLDAYREFEKKVDDFKKLIGKQSAGKMLGDNEQKRFNNYNEAISFYIPPRLGIKARTALQHQIHKTNGVFSETIDDTKIVPPISQPKKRQTHLREAFFAEIEKKRLLNEYTHQNELGIYTGGDDQSFADYLSDFETLPPPMRETFGPSLCNLLSSYFEKDHYCSGPKWV